VALDEALTITLIVVGVIIACLIVIFGFRRLDKKEQKPSVRPDFSSELTPPPFKITKSVQTEAALQAKDELRMLDLEREILSDAIRRLYEAQADGKITEEERDKLAESYKSRMMTVKDAISKDESVVALHELETMQQDLMKLFSERFDDLNQKIEELRSKAEARPIKEIAIPTTATKALSKAEMETEKETEEEKAKRKKKPAATKASTPRTEAEKRIEEIQSEVEKVLDRLGQMESES
jgi:hypothetical protein